MPFGRGMRVGLAAALLAAASATPSAQPPAIDIGMFTALSWRSVGPLRGGRTTAVAGVHARPNVFYAGTADGGAWKTTDAGRTWRPVFDDQPVGAIGSIAVAASDAAVVYAGTGEAPVVGGAAPGNGLYRSNDAGRTWAHLGLANSRHIPSVLVDPGNPDRIFVAAMGSASGAGGDRGVFRSTDGGRTFSRVLFPDEDTGALDLAFDPADASVVFATLWQTRRTASGTPLHGPGTGVYRSTDGGATWQPVHRGLPTHEADGLRRVRIAVAPGDGSRVFAAVSASANAGVYRSDDRGSTWSRAGTVPDLSEEDANVSLAIDPSNPDVVYATGRHVHRSHDAGRTFTTWRRDPAGGGYHRIWLSSSGMSAALAGDRGAVITVNAGETWSPGFNQPTGQFGRVTTDHSFPYRICGAELGQPPGCVPSRGPLGQAASDHWQVVGGTPDSAVAPDPQDADVIFTGAVGRFDRRTGQVQDVAPAEGREWTSPDRPLVFASDNRTLYYGGRTLWRSTNGGQAWTAIGPEPGRRSDDGPGDGTAGPGSASTGPQAPDTISTVDPSSIDPRLIWVGTSDGRVLVTRDAGASWSIAALAVRARVSSVEASHFDTNTAYAAADASALGDRQPRVWRTRDGGATWTTIAPGLPDGGVVHAVREDTFRRGLLFAATARSVFVSFDDGDRWQPLRLNLPPTAVTDLTVRDADLVIATGGRGFWVLDDISMFRQVTADIARSDVFLFRPATTWRTRSRPSPRARVPGDAPSGVPDGVAIGYLVGAGAPLFTIEIIETLTGEVIRRYSSAPATDDATVRLATTPGVHRVVWDLKYAPLDGLGIWVMPGTYQVRLTAGQRIARQAVIVRMDPRVRTSVADLTSQFKLSRVVDDERRSVAAARARLGPGLDRSTPALSATALDEAARDLRDVLERLQQSDTRPTAALEAAAARAIERARALTATAD